MKTGSEHIERGSHSLLHDHHLLVEVILVMMFLIMLSLLFAESAY